ncbi:MAG: dihydroorotate dehydrogenase [bacterium]
MDISVKIGKMHLKNPLIGASGTFGYGFEFADFMDLNNIGGFCTKGISLEPRPGNPYPRVAETASGMLNSIGLENCGSDSLIRDVFPRIESLDCAVIVNIYASNVHEFAILAEKISQYETVDAFEINLSCPNVSAGGAAFGADPETVEKVTSLVVKNTDKTVIVKLSPNVTDIRETASAAESGGAHSISLINTLIGTAVDRENRRYFLGNKIGGLSGPAIKPVALKMVRDAVKTVSIPVIGIGGIRTVEDVLDFLIIGASAVQIGGQNFIEPSVLSRLAGELSEYLDRKNEELSELTGSIRED